MNKTLVPPDWAAIGDRIKEARRRKGLTQREVAEPLITPSFLSLLESGARQASEPVLDHIATRLDVDPLELMTGRSPTLPVELELRVQEARHKVGKRDFPAATEELKAIQQEAIDAKLARVEAKTWELLAQIELQKGLVDAALALYRRAEEAWESEPEDLRFETIAGIALCLLTAGKSRLAIHELEGYLTGLKRRGIEHPTALMRANSALVACYTTAGMPELAAEAADRALGLTPLVHDPEQLACTNMNVAYSLLERGRVEDALGTVREAERLFLSLGWQRDAARAQLNRGIIQTGDGDYEAAQENLTEALVAARRLDDRPMTGMCLNELGRAKRLAGRSDEAIAHLEEAKSLLKETDLQERAMNFRELGLAVAAADPEEAKAHLRRAIDLYLVADLRHEVAATYRCLGDLQREHGEAEASADSYRAGLEAMVGRRASI